MTAKDDASKLSQTLYRFNGDTITLIFKELGIDKYDEFKVRIIDHPKKDNNGNYQIKAQIVSPIEVRKVDSQEGIIETPYCKFSGEIIHIYDNNILIKQIIKSNEINI